MIAAAASALALIDLDAASIGPFLLSRPFVVGPVIGWALGDALKGALLGAVFEVMTLDDLPLGGAIRLSASSAAGVATWLWAGPRALPAEAAFFVGLAVGWAHGRLERAIRRVRGGWARRAEDALSAGRRPRLGTEIAGALAFQVATTFAVAAAALAAAGPALSWVWPLLPEVLRAGVRTAFLAAPWIAAGSLASSLWRRS